jgi:CRISPR system Cascade subunit CasB
VTNLESLTIERAFAAGVAAACKDPGTQSALRAASQNHSDRRRMTVARVLDPLIPDGERIGAPARPFHVVAALIAQLPRDRALRVSIEMPAERYPRSLGRCLAQAVARRELDEESAERLLKRVLWSTPAVLYAQLPHLVRRMPERADAIDYPQLLAHLRAWPRRRKAISERWNDDFFDELTRASARRAEAADETANN